MSAKWEKLEGNRGVLTVEVPVEKVNEGLDSAFKKVVKQVQVPGFRKGKMPRSMFEKRFGVESLYQDALDFILPEAYAEAINETAIETALKSISSVWKKAKLLSSKQLLQ